MRNKIHRSQKSNGIKCKEFFSTIQVDCIWKWRKIIRNKLSDTSKSRDALSMWIYWTSRKNKQRKTSYYFKVKRKNQRAHEKQTTYHSANIVPESIHVNPFWVHPILLFFGKFRKFPLFIVNKNRINLASIRIRFHSNTIRNS